MRISDGVQTCALPIYERGGDAVQIGAGNMRVGDDHRAPAVQERRDLRVDIGEQSVVDQEIGRASCRDRVCKYVSNSVVAVYLNKKKTKGTKNVKHTEHRISTKKKIETNMNKNT